MTGIPFPNIDPIALSIGPLQIHWYALAYVAGFLGGWLYAAKLLRSVAQQSPMTPELFEDLLPWAIAGVILGGRIVYTLVYNPALYAQAPLEALKLWQGGMSFHGGFLGVLVAVALWARSKKIAFLAVTDIAAVVTPIGLFFGRLANFINGELFGRVTTAPWGVIFPNGGTLPRHPSQIYQALLEGLVLFVVLYFVARRKDAWTKHGLPSGIFLIGYALARITAETVREPDAQIGFLFNSGITMGQLLSLPLLIAGFWIIHRWTRLKA
jgi:phosphatidylglycerol:prolipoprotein diacylglycerol transferase